MLASQTLGTPKRWAHPNVGHAGEAEVGGALADDGDRRMVGAARRRHRRRAVAQALEGRLPVEDDRVVQLAERVPADKVGREPAALNISKAPIKAGTVT